jgi:hypothetical protein
MLARLIDGRGLAALLSAAFILIAPAAKAEEDVWPQLKQQTFGDREIKAEDGMPRSCR